MWSQLLVSSLPPWALLPWWAPSPQHMPAPTLKFMGTDLACEFDFRVLLTFWTPSLHIYHFPIWEKFQSLLCKWMLVSWLHLNQWLPIDSQMLNVVSETECLTLTDSTLSPIKIASSSLPLASPVKSAPPLAEPWFRSPSFPEDVHPRPQLTL